MQGCSTKLEYYMSAASARFDIPVYQRNYDWREKHCKQLYDDLVRIIRENRKTHFFGSMISVLDHFGSEIEFLVIDGQQRLTTISLLCLAMYNLLRKHNFNCEDQSYIATNIWVKFLVDELIHARLNIKMRNIREDQEAYLKLFTDDPSQFISESNITKNYLYFYNRIIEQEIPIDKLYEAITRLEIIKITLDTDDDPQLVFESLNSTGLALEDADKIRNFIFMGMTREEQVYHFENYWNPLQKLTKNDLTPVLYHYLTRFYKDTVRYKDVYFEFKDYYYSAGLTKEEVLQRLLKFAKG